MRIFEGRCRLGLLLLCASPPLIGNCALAGEPWFRGSPVRSVCLDDSVRKNVFVSSDGQKRIEVHESAGFRFVVNDRRIAWAAYDGPVVLPMHVSWSPSSNAFFVNDGEGSGLWSRLRVFQLTLEGVEEVRDIHAAAVAAFRSSRECPSSAADPATWGIGWSADGARVFAFAQATVHNPCGQQGDFRGLTLELKRPFVRRVLSERETRQSFGHLLPENMRKN